MYSQLFHCLLSYNVGWLSWDLVHWRFQDVCARVTMETTSSQESEDEAVTPRGGRCCLEARTTLCQVLHTIPHSLPFLSSLLPPNLSYPNLSPSFPTIPHLLSNILYSSLCIRWVTIGARIFSPTSLLKVKLYPITCISFSCCLCVQQAWWSGRPAATRYHGERQYSQEYGLVSRSCWLSRGGELKMNHLVVMATHIIGKHKTRTTKCMFRNWMPKSIF